MAPQIGLELEAFSGREREAREPAAEILRRSRRTSDAKILQAKKWLLR